VTMMLLSSVCLLIHSVIHPTKYSTLHLLKQSIMTNLPQPFSGGIYGNHYEI
jgi:hypothetical protein